MRLVICRPELFPLRRITHCSTCNRRRRFAGLDAPWYGVTWTCCGCGDSWADGERLQRPFRRGWRAEAKKHAKAVWAEAAGRTADERRQWIREQLGMEGAA